MKLYRLTFALTAIFITLAAAQAQGRKPLPSDDQSQYLVSARAGVVNVVEGDVSFERAGKSDMLIAGDVVRSGDLVKTGANGRAEILLNPGSYLRLSTNTEFIFKDTRIHRLELALLKGSAIIEASVVVETIKVITPQA
ncbi:MAG TPA: FecR domain-containing protein, partial [Blastocatellia bacterium]|nr:FecR domain-containing protein [Blastocatellia bacterium]